MPNIACPFCSCPLSPKSNFKEYLMHIRLLHSNLPNFKMVCGIGGCLRAFTNFRTFKNHVSASHSYTDLDSIEEASGSGTTTSPMSEDESHDDGDEQFEPMLEDDDHFHEERARNPLKVTAALLLLKLKEQQKLTQVALQAVIDGVTGLFDAHIEELRTQICSKLGEAGLSWSSVPGLHEVFDEESMRRPFLGLETAHQQLTFYRQHLNLIEPVRVPLGRRHVWKGTGTKRRCVVKDDHAMYIPLLQTLQTLLKNDTILSEVMAGHTSSGEVMEDYCDGTVFKTHPLFSAKPNSLQIQLYYDDVEVCNPLGSKAKVHKIGAFYFTLGNLRPKYRSRLSGIHLVSVVSHKLLAMYGIDAVLKNFVEDVKKLEAGYSFDIDRKPTTLCGTVSIVSADNLGSLALGGFKESCSAYRMCRQCLATKDDTQSLFLESQFTVRCKETHKDHCTLLQGDSAVEMSKKFGINRDALMNELKYFHVCDGALVPDIMHDVLEGALEYEVKLMLNVMISAEQYFSLQQLNSRFENFDYGYMEVKDRPTLIAPTTLHSEGNKLKQQASQMWLLGRLFPLLIGDQIPEADDHWLNFLKLMEIVDILFSPQISEDNAAYLAALISDHHGEFRRLYPSHSVIPKMHFMVHMPRIMIQYGPLVCHWTMRYEAKHSYFKKLAQTMGNFINLPYSLSMRHQQLECYHSVNTHEIPGGDLEAGPGSTVLDCSLAEQVGRTVSTAYETKWVKIDGSMWRKGAGFVHNMQDDMPEIGEIKKLLILNGATVIFQADTFKTTYHPHFRCYSLERSKSCDIFVELDSLPLNKPLHIRNPASLAANRVVVLPYYLYSTT